MLVNDEDFETKKMVDNIQNSRDYNIKAKKLSKRKKMI